MTTPVDMFAGTWWLLTLLAVYLAVRVARAAMVDAGFDPESHIDPHDAPWTDGPIEHFGRECPACGEPVGPAGCCDLEPLRPTPVLEPKRRSWT